MRSGYVNSDNVIGRLFATCSVPHAGKSSFCNSWVSDRTAERPRVVLSGDDFRKAMHGQEYARAAEGIVASIIDIAARALLDRGFDVIMDETCTSEMTFARYMRLDPNFQIIFVEATEEVCIERVLKNGKDFLVPVIKKLYPQFQWMKGAHEELRAKYL